MNVILERVYSVCKQVREDSTVPTTFKNLIRRTRNTFKLHEFDIALRSKKDKKLDKTVSKIILFPEGMFLCSFFCCSCISRTLL